MGGPTHYRTTWRGVVTCNRMAMIADAACALLPFGHRLGPSQGSYNGTSVAASGGTHAGCGVLDISRFFTDNGIELTFDELIQVADAFRQPGGFGYARKAIPNVWPNHAHVGAKDCYEMAAALVQQQRDYEAGRDGLMPRGRDGLSINLDTGSRAWVNVTFETYQPPTPTPHDAPPEDDMTPEEHQMLVDLHSQATAFNSTNPGEAARVMPFFRLAARYGAGDSIVGYGVSGAADPAHNGVNQILSAVPDAVTHAVAALSLGVDANALAKAVAGYLAVGAPQDDAPPAAGA